MGTGGKRTRRAAVLLASTVLVSGAAAGCGGGGGETRSGATALAKWSGQWTDNVTAVSVSSFRIPRVNPIRIPRPPPFDPPTGSEAIVFQATSSSDDLSRLIDSSYSEVKRVYCQWFGFYVDTGTPVPSAEQFPELLLQYGLGRILPPGHADKRIYDAANSFRAAIERGQSTGEDVALASTAGICSLP
jgi:hypothetical protein